MRKREFNFPSEHEVIDCMVNNNGCFVIKQSAHGKKTQYHSYNDSLIDMYDMLEQGKFGNDDTQLFTYQDAVEQAKKAKMDGDDKFYEKLMEGILQFEDEQKRGVCLPNDIICIDDSVNIIPRYVLNFVDDIYTYELGVEYNED